MLKKSLFIALSIALLVSFAFAGTVQGAEKVLRIGVVGPESGGAAQLGQGQRKAAQMAVDEINANKLAGDWKLEVFFEDDEGNPTKCANVANKLIQQDKIHVMIGAINSSATLAAMVITGRAGIPHITAGSTGDSITNQGNKWIFRTAVNDEFQADALMRYAKNDRGFKKVAMFTAADDYGQSGARLLAKAAAAEGIEVVSQQTYNNGDKDFKPQLISIQNAGAEGVFMWGLYLEAALIVKQARQLGLDAQFFGASGMAAQKLIELGEEAAQGLVLTQSFLPSSDSPAVVKFVEGYNARYNETPIPHGAQAYDTVYIIADAVKRTGSTDPAKLRDALASTSGLSLVTGSPKFGEKGDDLGKNILLTIIEGDSFKLFKTVSGN
jgi:branched-chain amino acid transport system substrate-binding protein